MVAEIVFESCSPSAVHTAPETSQARFAATATVTAAFEEGVNVTVHRSLRRFTRRRSATAPPVTSNMSFRIRRKRLVMFSLNASRSVNALLPSCDAGAFSNAAVNPDAATTVAVAPLRSVSSAPPSSVNVARALIVLPASAVVNVYVDPVASAISASADPSFAIHRQAKTAFVRPSASATPEADAVSVSPTCAVPVIVGRPVGAVLAAGVTGCDGADAAPLPAAFTARTRKV